MWKWRPLTEAKRQRKIARLETRRDRMLRNAPFAFFMTRLVTALFFLAITVVFSLSLRRLLLAPPSDLKTLIVNIVLPGLLVFLFGFAAWRVWFRPRPAPNDLWAYADRVEWDGNGPRDIQRRIDALRAQSVGADKECNARGQRAGGRAGP